MRTLGPGDLFGESALLLGTARTADITVTSPQATVLCLADKAVRTSSEHQEWGRILDANLLTILATRLRDAHALTG